MNWVQVTVSGQPTFVNADAIEAIQIIASGTVFTLSIVLAGATLELSSNYPNVAAAEAAAEAIALGNVATGNYWPA